MKNILYTCDRCRKGGLRESQMQVFTCEFGKQMIDEKTLSNSSLPNISTGDLCPTCAHSWQELFFNQVKDFTQNKPREK
jgi:hypothetical protein